MNAIKHLGRRAVWLGTAMLLFTACAAPGTAAQVSGTYRTAPGTKGTFYFGNDSASGITVSADITTTFSGDNPTTMLTATIHQPLIGVLGDGTAPPSVASLFPLSVKGTSTDGVTFRGELFPGSAVLLGIADALVELKAVCHCGRKATMNLRIDESGAAVKHGAQTEIGGNDRYVALCRRHFGEALRG